jgi:two-component system, NarL family, response regulator
MPTLPEFLTQWDSNMANYSLLVVSDSPILGRGLANLIESGHGLTVAAEVSDGRAAVGVFGEFRPDVALIDLSTKGSADVTVVQKIIGYDPKAKLVAYATFDRTEGVQAVLRAGARGYICADSTIEELLEGVLCVAGGEKYFAPSATAKLAQRMWPDALSYREMQILRLLATGMTNRDIGLAARISEETVKSHVNRILAKLDVGSRTEAVVVAVRKGVIKID